MKKTIIFLIIISFGRHSYSQVLLDADGERKTYELITEVLAPGGNPIETPDCSHPEFGDHIDMILDPDLNIYVFRFFIHKTPDNDRCINFDRQRNEIKTYSESPDNLLGTIGETFEYKWKFKIDNDFQASSSFTHLHQLKAVGGAEEGMPLFTFTARKGSPNKLELRYAEHLTQETLYAVDLTPFKGNWVQVVETVTYGESGSYSVKITKVDDGSTLMEYSNNSLRMWKTDAEFIRPKWGIYRSLNNPDDLRDETLLFANFSIKESTSTGLLKLNSEKGNINLYPNPVKDMLCIENDTPLPISKIVLSDIHGKTILEKPNQLPKSFIDFNTLPKGMYVLHLQTMNGVFFKKIIK